jgi:hypothetical protein
MRAAGLSDAGAANGLERPREPGGKTRPLELRGGLREIPRFHLSIEAALMIQQGQVFKLKTKGPAIANLFAGRERTVFALFRGRSKPGSAINGSIPTAR